ncbi:unnamed protein product [Lupinus luteus]|uniref:MI domain-containing protein n=1 Tax=Lupinus luteus TaxID=3873 RepID=A0AAV1XHF3_LUPLU
MLKEVMTVIFNKAVEDTASCPMYSKLLSDLNEKLPPLPSEQPGGTDITVKTILLNIFQDCLKVPDGQFIPLGNIPFLFELYKQKLISDGFSQTIIFHFLGISGLPFCDVESLCHSLKTIGKQMDESSNILRLLNDKLFSILNEFCSNTFHPPHLRSMLCDVLKLRANNWIPMPDPAHERNVSLHRVVVSFFLEKYFSGSYSIDASKFVNDLESPDFHPYVVTEAISMGLSKSPPCVEAVVDFLKDMFTKSTFSSKDIVQGCFMFISPVDAIALDLSELPKEFGSIIGELILAGCIDFKAV